MIGWILGFIGFYVFFGMLGLVFKITFGLFKWIFLFVLSIGTGILVLGMAIPLFVIVPIAIILYLAFQFVAGFLGL